MKRRIEENDEVAQKKFNISCCKSYLTPKGRCYTCPELETEKDPDEEPW